jgi:proline iminopeptidase
MRVARKVAGAVGILGLAYALWVRPRLWRWGASDEEVAGPYPGAELVPDGERGATMAVTIEAPPDQVWPWLVQMGGDRAGWYSWDRLDNAGRPSAQEVHPEWQDLALGDYVMYWRPDGPVDAWEVAALEPNRFLGLRGLTDLRGRNLDPKQPRPSAYLEGLWGFLLNELPGGCTRLVISGYQKIRPRWLGRFVFYWLYIPVTWIMQSRMLAVLKRNIERAGKRMSNGPAPEGCLSSTRLPLG